MGTYRFSLVKTRHRKSSHRRASDHCVLLSVELRRSAVDQPSTGVAATAEVKDDLLQASPRARARAGNSCSSDVGPLQLVTFFIP